MPKRPPTTPLRCPKCGKTEDPEHPRIGPKATGAENTRSRDGVERDAYHMKCQSCKWQFWSVTPRAKTLHKAIDATVRPKKRHRRQPA